MTQMPLASCACDLGARHACASIRLFDDVLFLDRRPETRPAGPRIKLLCRAEHRQFASGAFKCSFVVYVIQRARKSIFSSLVPQNVVLLRRQLALPLCISLDHFFDSFGFSSLSFWERARVRAYRQHLI